jgi:hypothetical protein
VRSFVWDHRHVLVHLEHGADPAGVLGQLGAAEGVVVGSVLVAKADGAPLLQVPLKGRPGLDLSAVLSEVSARDDVVSLEASLTSE